MSIKIVTATGRGKCRGRFTNCAAVNGLIPKGSPSLEIAISAANGGATAYFCFKCAEIQLEQAKQAIIDLGI